MTKLCVMGVDAAFANMGLACAYVDLHDTYIECRDLRLCKTDGDDRKVVRKSSSDLRRAQELVTSFRNAVAQWRPSFVFAEVPSGAQSASAARALGIAVGVLASCSEPLIEVSPGEVKQAVSGLSAPRMTRKGPSKDDVINWATKRWPEAPWLMHRGMQKPGGLLKANEHLADAMAVIVAGLATPEFQRLLTALRVRQPSSRLTRRVIL